VGKLKTILVLIFLLIFFKIFFYLENNNKSFYIGQKVILKGRVIDFQGNNMPSNTPKNLLLNKSKIKEVVFTKGKIKKTNNSPEINLSDINKKLFFKTTDKNGGFNLILEPGIYTFFIKFEDKLYLNKFDSFEYFQSITVTKNMKPIKIYFDKYILN
tara:strand:- start:191 stop:661 length:471 start_codon:yes stop_codon:yes gene_type:complete